MSAAPSTKLEPTVPEDATPNPPPPDGEPNRSLRISTIEGAFASIHGTITAGALATGYGLMLGANDFHLGMMAAMGALASVGNAISARLVGLLGRRKALCVAASVTSRCVWGILAALPFLAATNAVKLRIFLGLLFISGLASSIAGNAWLSWMTDLVPVERRGRYFGRRNTLFGVVTIATGFLSGRLYDLLNAQGHQQAAFAILFGVATLSALICGSILSRQWEPPAHGELAKPLAHLLSLPLKNAEFRLFLVFSMLWTAATAVASPFFGAHMIRNLHMPYSLIALYSIVATLFGLASQPFWGAVVDRMGNRPVLVATACSVAFLPMIWVFPKTGFYLPLWIDAALTGLLWPGLGIAMFNLPMVTAPRENRQAYFAVLAMCNGITALLASLSGGWIADAFSNVSWLVCGRTIVNYHIVFALSTVCRLLVIPLATRLKEDGATSVVVLLNYFGDKVLRQFTGGIQSSLAMVSRLKR